MSNLEYSVALCTFNGEKYVSQQLESIINQSIKPKEIIISDDGSKDKTIEIVGQILENSGVAYQILINNEEHGVTNNFRNAISHCAGPIVFTSDQDDQWHLDKAKIMLDVFEKNSKALLVFSDGELVDADMNLLNCSVWKAVGIKEEFLRENNWFHYLLNTCLVTGAAMAFRKSLYDSVNTIPKEWLHDGWLAWCAVASDGLVPCEQRLFYYRQHSNNVVGMSPSYALMSKIRGYLNNFSDISRNRHIRYYRYKSLYEYLGNHFTETQQAEMLECIGFWKEQVEMEDNDSSKFKSLFVITRLFLKGYYNRFFVGFHGYVRDVFLIFIKIKQIY